MRQTLQRRCGFEAIESMTLLSGLVAAPVSNPAPLPIHLTGSISEIYNIKTVFATGDLGAGGNALFPVTKGSGSISPLGAVTEKGEPALTSVWLKAENGAVSVVINQPTDEWPEHRSAILKFFEHAGNVLTGEFTLGGGGGAYAGATGSGNIQITTLGRDKSIETFS
jgi:hypothetical protein